MKQSLVVISVSFNQFLSFSYFFSFFISFTILSVSLNISPPASPPRSVVLDCLHVSIIDYSVISELRDLLRQFKLREVRLVFSRLQVRPSALTGSQTFIEC